MVMRRGVEQHMVGADTGEGRSASGEQRPHLLRIRHAVVGRDHHRLRTRVCRTHTRWSFIPFPVAFSGSSPRNSTYRGALNPAIRWRHQAIRSSSDTVPFAWGTTKALPT